MGMNKPVILTGLRANNDLHIGNYFGAMLPLVDMAKTRSAEFQVNIFVPDLHSFTTPIDHGQLYGNILRNLRLFVAAGLPLDDADVHIYRQSYVPAHSELTWILDCFTGMGEMARMTQFKDKAGAAGKSASGESAESQAHEAHVSVGLFNYPVLMACDILLYGASYVPVGDDQSQHLEFTRDIAERMNTKFGQLFELPKPVKEQHEFFGKDQGLRIKDLQDPTKKMSKSDASGKGIIFLSDDPELARQKIMSAATDSLAQVVYDPERQPGIANLLQIYGLLTDKTAETAAQDFAGQTQYGEFKKRVADTVVVFLEEFQVSLAQVDEQAVMAKLETSEAAMREQAGKTLLRVQRAVGLRPKRSAETTKKRASYLAKPKVVDFEDFVKLDIRMGTILEAKAVEGSDKLIELTIDLGSEKRTVVTGMREFYEPASFVGKQLPVIANLKPQTFKGTKSHGMLMAVEGQNGPVLLLPEQSVLPGSPLE